MAKDNYKVYIAGPMRGIPEFNFPAFDNAMYQLEDLGFDVFSPADHDREGGFSTRGLTGNEDLERIGFDLRDALTWDLQKVMESDLVVVLPGYQKSTGAAAEIALAEALGTPWCALDAAMYIAPTATEVINSINTYTPLQEFKQKRIDEFLKNLKINKAPNPGYASGGLVQGHVIPQGVVDRWSKAGLEKLTVDPKLVSDNFVKGTEVRSVSSTGGEKGKKLASISSLDPHSLSVVSEVAGFGANKYAKLNFMKGYDWSLSYDALMRHLLAFWSGEDRDEESNMLHIGHAAWHCLALISFYERGLGTDDRYTSTPDLCNLQTKSIG